MSDSDQRRTVIYVTETFGDPRRKAILRLSARRAKTPFVPTVTVKDAGSAGHDFLMAEPFPLADRDLTQPVI
jgi:hypothetical protein